VILADGLTLVIEHRTPPCPTDSRFPGLSTLVDEDVCEVAVNRVAGREAQDMVYPAGPRVISPEDQA
jgi:hypothetical protein